MLYSGFVRRSGFFAGGNDVDRRGKAVHFCQEEARDKEEMKCRYEWRTKSARATLARCHKSAGGARQYAPGESLRTRAQLSHANHLHINFSRESARVFFPSNKRKICAHEIIDAKIRFSLLELFFPSFFTEKQEKVFRDR